MEGAKAEGWLGGDLMNLVVGQGPILATPLQMAVAYASILNGGTVYQPRVVDSIESPVGGTAPHDGTPRAAYCRLRRRYGCIATRRPGIRGPIRDCPQSFREHGSAGRSDRW